MPEARHIHNSKGYLANHPQGFWKNHRQTRLSSKALHHWLHGFVDHRTEPAARISQSGGLFTAYQKI
jgi:hypothetical protein